MKMMTKKVYLVVFLGSLTFIAEAMKEEGEKYSNIIIKGEEPPVQKKAPPMNIYKTIQGREFGLSPKIVSSTLKKIINEAEKGAILSVKEKNITRLSNINFDLYPEKKSEIYQNHYVQYICAYGYWKLFSDTTKNGQVQILPGWYLNPPAPLSKNFEGCKQITFSTQDSVHYSIIQCPKVFTLNQLKNLMHYASKSNRIQKIVFQDRALFTQKLVMLINNSSFSGLVTFDENQDLLNMKYNETIFVNSRSFRKIALEEDQKTPFTNILSKNDLYARLIVFDPRPNMAKQTPLGYALNNLYKIERLLFYGADPNMQIEFQYTPLMLVFEYLERQDIIEKVKLLLQYGADTNIRDYEGNTALSWLFKKYEAIFVEWDENEDFSLETLRSNVVEIVGLLIQYGADPTIKNNTGKKPIDFLTDENLKATIVDRYSVFQ